MLKILLKFSQNVKFNIKKPITNLMLMIKKNYTVSPRLTRAVEKWYKMPTYTTKPGHKMLTYNKGLPTFPIHHIHIVSIHIFPMHIIKYIVKRFFSHRHKTCTEKMSTFSVILAISVKGLMLGLIFVIFKRIFFRIFSRNCFPL